mmetsp:Transcript_81283/g.227890  ORF Transcript_81283/g.227890 Transcript_81283/m.227890 type:complete len:203 (-) Transcript_81283:399-1007(-)
MSVAHVTAPATMDGAMATGGPRVLADHDMSRVVAPAPTASGNMARALRRTTTAPGGRARARGARGAAGAGARRTGAAGAATVVAGVAPSSAAGGHVWMPAAPDDDDAVMTMVSPPRGEVFGPAANVLQGFLCRLRRLATKTSRRCRIVASCRPHALASALSPLVRHLASASRGLDVLYLLLLLRAIPGLVADVMATACARRA